MGLFLSITQVNPHPLPPHLAYGGIRSLGTVEGGDTEIGVQLPSGEVRARPSLVSQLCLALHELFPSTLGAFLGRGCANTFLSTLLSPAPTAFTQDARHPPRPGQGKALVSVGCLASPVSSIGFIPVTGHLSRAGQDLLTTLQLWLGFLAVHLQAVSR